MKSKWFLSAFCAFFLVLGAALAVDDKPREAAAPAEKTAAKKFPDQDPAKGSLEGKILFEGKMPEIVPFKVPDNHQDHASCAAHVKQEKLILSEKNEVKDALVSVAKYKPAEKAKPREITLDNKDCAFVPHVQATTVGSSLKITNSDKFLHNTRGVLSLSFNNAIGAGQVVEKTLKKPGWGVVSCDFHTWMQAHIWIFDHDLFDVTGTDGTYKVPNVPPGEYEIDIWHEYPLQAQKQKVKIEAGKATKLDVMLKAVQK